MATIASPNVAFVRQELLRIQPQWDLIKDCLSGQERVKEQRTVYLPQPNAADRSEENFERYRQYVCRAVFYNVTGRTLNGLVGEVFSKDPVVEVPPNLDPIKKDVDGGGVTLDQQAKKALGQVLAFGRSGLLVDYPVRATPVSKAEAAAGNIRPTISLIDPWDVINWRVETIGAQKLLTLVVIGETQTVGDDGFELKTQSIYRVLRLNELRQYQVELWVASDINGAGGTVKTFEMIAQYVPTDGSGQPWKFIPFTFIGVENNDANIDLPPLYDLASLNIAHYRNSADYEEACFIAGQPTPYLSGLTEQWVKQVMKGVVQLGSRAAIMLPENGQAGLLQAAENSMPKEAMEMKERQMVALGAKLVEQKQVQRTATEAGMEEASETSVLCAAAKNISQAYESALRWAAGFLGQIKDEEVSYSLNDEFSISKLEAPMVAALISAWQANAITFEEMRDKLRRGDVAYLDDDEAMEQMEAAGPNLGLPVTEQARADKEAADAAAAAALAAKNGDPVDA